MTSEDRVTKRATRSGEGLIVSLASIYLGWGPGPFALRLCVQFLVSLIVFSKDITALDAIRKGVALAGRIFHAVQGPGAWVCGSAASAPAREDDYGSPHVPALLSLLVLNSFYADNSAASAMPCPGGAFSHTHVLLLLAAHVIGARLMRGVKHDSPSFVSTPCELLQVSPQLVLVYLAMSSPRVIPAILIAQPYGVFASFLASAIALVQFLLGVWGIQWLEIWPLSIFGPFGIVATRLVSLCMFVVIGGTTAAVGVMNLMNAPSVTPGGELFFAHFSLFMLPSVAFVTLVRECLCSSGEQDEGEGEPEKQQQQQQKQPQQEQARRRPGKA